MVNVLLTQEYRGVDAAKIVRVQTELGAELIESNIGVRANPADGYHIELQGPAPKASKKADKKADDEDGA